MLLYLVILIFLSINCFLDDFNNNIINGYKYVNHKIMVFILIIIGGFRLNIGADFNGYMRMFQSTLRLGEGILSQALNSHGEVGFWFVNSFLKTFLIDHFSIMFLFFVLVPILLNIKSIKSYNKKYFYTSFFLYIVFYFFGREMAQIRMGMSTSICFYSIRYLKNNNNIKYIITILIAMSFHLASFIMLPFILVKDHTFILSFKKLRVNFYIIFLTFGIIITQIDWLIYFEDFLLSNIPVGTSYLLTDYTSSISLISFTYFRRLLPVIIGLISYNYLNERFKYFSLSYNLLFFGVIFSLAFHEASIYATRLFTPLIFNEILIYSYAKDYLKQKSKYLFYAYQLIIIIIGGFFLLNLLTSRSLNYIPYNSIF